MLPRREMLVLVPLLPYQSSPAPAIPNGRLPSSLLVASRRLTLLLENSRFLLDMRRDAVLSWRSGGGGGGGALA